MWPMMWVQQAVVVVGMGESPWDPKGRVGGAVEVVQRPLVLVVPSPQGQVG